MSNRSYEYSSESNNHYMFSPEITPGLYDGTSCDSAASSPLNCNAPYDQSYTSNNLISYNSFSLQYPMHSEEFAPIGLIPVDLDVESLYDVQDRRKKKGSSDKVVSSHVHSRRRAQNRASQRAFRDRKEKHMKDLEKKLEELEGRHNGLSRSYESLQQEYSLVKSELEHLRKKKKEESNQEPERKDSATSEDGDWDHSPEATTDPMLFEPVDYWSGDYGESYRQH